MDTMDFPHASEMAAKAASAADGPLRLCIEKISMAIRKAADNGHRRVMFDGWRPEYGIRAEVVRRLESRGYRVSEGESQRDGYWFTVTW